MNDRRYTFMQVDAFTDKRFQGNPCAVVFGADDLSVQEMQSIAREMNLSETAFIQKSQRADFRFRFFTLAEEIPLAGHPTIATVFALIEKGLVSLDQKVLRVELTAGDIDVFIEDSSMGPLITMQQLRPQFLNCYNPKDILSSFGLTEDQLIPGAPVQTVSTGSPMLMIPLKSKRCLTDICFSPNDFLKLFKKSDFLSAHLFVIDSGETFARHFSPPPEIAEDPFTGSATGAMACYLRHYDMIETLQFAAHQGEYLGRPGHARVEVLENETEVTGVKVSGTAVTSLVGELLV